MVSGGTFNTGVEKIRPGIYTNFKSAAVERTKAGERGTVALPLSASWGAAKEFVEINKVEDVEKKLGLDLSHPSFLLLREAMKLAKTVLVYRLNDGSKATATLATDIIATAKYGGKVGNSITIKVDENVVDSTKKDVTTYLNEVAVDRQVVSVASDLINSNYVTFETTDTSELQNTAGTTLVGGTDQEVTNLDYTQFLVSAEGEYFDTIAFPVPSDDMALKTSFVSFVKRMRDEQGVKIKGVVANMPADYEGIINVRNGVTLQDETVLESHQVVAWVAGADASASMLKSNTFVKYEGAIDATPRLANDETEEALQNGEFVLTFDARDKAVYVEQDINSLITFTKEKSAKFRKNKISRILDGINNDTRRNIMDAIKERKDANTDIPADDNGVQYILSMQTAYLNELQSSGAIANFDSTADITVTLNENVDGFIVNQSIEPVDSGEKFYFTTEVK
ncbi:phage tail sheath family protein [Listeria ivanovii subsp. londoniensis]|uniref:phage tail sheath family protein n=1 Tax=Listeria ivanovii TaxID=1638 RepID=UPI001908531D|nr:phage tail sheath family protein [Listeria ivanovii]EHH5516367.1 phage tail sheath protein [Listeria monocytogenes]EJZ0334575.1 phage tail sheath family protein [Listeria monocytogenes]EJZ0534139.1 phage tail sheath family protein [Listeria monocytogenes]EKH9260995.1 phage tail sheath family protein [Listeria monocytogenes]MBK1994986.1 phage tail sheath family protein [Listeria ivanovii subsp. londoniensis]